MAKSEKELAELREKIGQLDRELQELTDEELRQVSGGFVFLRKAEKTDGSFQIKFKVPTQI